MNYLQVENLTKHFGEVLMFNDISFTINKNEKVALIARNGAGKTTLFKIIAGVEIAENGNVSINKDVAVGFLHQDPDFDPELNVFDAVFHSLEDQARTLEQYEIAIENNDVDLISTLSAKIEREGLWDLDTEIKQMLSRFKITNLKQKVGVLSGGQKKRLALSVLLLQKPDFFILDEPTNHLDLDMIEWLEQYLNQNHITLFMITHDRYFLDRVCNTILELDDKTMYRYSGNYSYFLEKRADRVANQKSEIEKAKNIFKTELDWIRRQPKARGTKAKYRVDAFDAVKEKASQRIENKNVDLSVQSTRLGKKILEITGLNKAYGEKVLLKDFNYIFNRFEKVGIIGENGCGKSTFLNMITQQMDPDSGQIVVGETINYGYYEQKGLDFAPGKKVIEVITDIADHIELGKNRTMSAGQFLEHFLFEPRMHHLHVTTLSGGERKRLYLMTVLMKRPNFLILDEPTNDLDLLTLNVLEEYLQSFQGCLIIVSHDRHFMDKVVDHLFVFEGNGVIRDFPGNYSSYRAQKKENVTKVKVEVDAPKPVKDVKPKKKSTLKYSERLELEKLESEISEIEDKKKNLEAKLTSGSITESELVEISEQIGALMELADEKEMRWMELSEKAEGEE